MAGYVVKPLNKETWADFARLVERHNGVWGGCWCMEFHPEGAQRGADRRAQKEQRVRDGQAHPAHRSPRCRASMADDVEHPAGRGSPPGSHRLVDCSQIGCRDGPPRCLVAPCDHRMHGAGLFTFNPCLLGDEAVLARQEARPRPLIDRQPRIELVRFDLEREQLDHHDRHATGGFPAGVYRRDTGRALQLAAWRCGRVGAGQADRASDTVPTWSLRTPSLKTIRHSTRS